MLGQLSGEHEADGSLDLTAGKGSLLVVGGKLSGLTSNALEDIVDEGVHDGHALLGDTSVGVNLLQYFVDIGGVRFDTLLGTLLLAVGGGFLGCLSRSLLGWSLGHG